MVRLLHKFDTIWAVGRKGCVTSCNSQEGEENGTYFPKKNCFVP